MVVLFLSTLARSHITGTSTVVVLGHSVQSHLAVGLGVKFLVGSADSLLSGFSHLGSKVLSKPSPLNLWLIPVLLIISKETVVVRLVKLELELSNCPDQLIKCNKVVLRDETVDHAGEVQSGRLKHVVSDHLHDVGGRDLGFTGNRFSLRWVICQNNIPKVLSSGLFMNIFATLGALRFIKKNLSLMLCVCSHA